MRRCTTSALRLAVLLLFAASARGEDAAGPGLDLLVLVDRSGSMSSHSAAGVVDALPLALNVIARSARHSGLRHRFGIISFGSRARTEVPLTLVDSTTLARLRDRLGGLDSRSLGHTNFIPPFEAASAAFGALPDDARRRRAILLVTDGEAAVPGTRTAASAAELQRLTDAALSGSAITIDVLLVGPGGVPGAWERLSRGRLHRVETDRGEMLAAIHRVVTSLTGTRGVAHDLTAGSRTLILPPYLELVIFDIVRGAGAGEVSLVPPGATSPLDRRSPGVEEVHTGDVLSTVVVRRPAAGAWKIGASALTSRVKVLSQQFFPRGVLIAPAIAPPVRQHDFVTVAYALRDSDGTALRELPAYPLAVDVSLSLPDGRRLVLPMKRDPGSRAMYRTSHAAECAVAGRYWTEILVTTTDSRGQPVRVFEDRWSGFAVEAAERRPTHGAAVSFSALRPVAPAAASPARHGLLVLTLCAAALLFVAMRRR